MYLVFPTSSRDKHERNALKIHPMRLKYHITIDGIEKAFILQVHCMHARSHLKQRHRPLY